MIPLKQLHCSPVDGDCLRACICSIFEITNMEDLPNIHDEKWFFRWRNIFRSVGIEFEFDQDRIWRNGYWIASVKSKNFEGTTHAIVMKGQKVAFDPSPKKRYRKDTNLLGEDVVLGGYYFVIDDPILLSRLDEPAWWKQCESNA